MLARFAYASNFTRQLSQFASEPLKLRILMVFLVYRMPAASAAMAQGLAIGFLSNDWIRDSVALSLEQQRN